MKKQSNIYKCILIGFAIFTSYSIFAQTITLPLTEGGASGGGTILQVNPVNGNYIATEFSGALEASEKRLSVGELGGMFYEVSNNSIYITLNRGGRRAGNIEGYGAIYRYDITNNKLNLIIRMDQLEPSGSRPIGPMVKIGSKLFGVTEYGGIANKGVIFSIDLANNDAYNVEHSFNGTTDGGVPSCGLIVYNNELYGGGVYANGGTGTTVFKFNPSSNLLTSLWSFTGSGIKIKGMFVRNNLLYISKGLEIATYDLVLGGNLNSFYLGFDPNLGAVPSTYIQRPSNGKWYTTFQLAGINNAGTIAEITNNTSNPVIVTKQMAGFGAGAAPYTGLVNGLMNSMYGVAPASSTGNDYVLYELNVLDIYSVVHTFTNALVRMTPVLAGTKLYGIDEFGGTNGNGSIWSYDLANSQFSSVLDLGYSLGRSPVNKIVDLGNGKSLGVTFGGNSIGGRGTLFEFNNNDQSVRAICNIDSSLTFANWYKPFLCNGNIYILNNINSSQIGTYNSSFVISKLDTVTGNFSQSTALSPGLSTLIQTGNIVQSNNLLYGANNKDIWKFDLSTMTYSALYTYSGSVSPGGTFLKDSLLFVTSETNNTGVISKLNLNTNVKTDVATTASNKFFYSIVGDSTSLYTYRIDKINKKAEIYSLSYGTYTLNQVAIIDSATIGYDISDAYLMIAGNNLYGVTPKGSDYGKGSIFKCSISNGIITKLLALNTITGYRPFRCEMTYNQNATIGIEELSENINSFLAFPNPSINEVEFSIGMLDDVKVISGSGAVVFQGKKISKLNIENLQSGIYFIIATQNNRQYNSKIIK